MHQHRKKPSLWFSLVFQTKKRAAVPLAALFLLDYECFPVGHDHQHPAPDVNGCGLAGVALPRCVRLCGCSLGFFLFELQRFAVGRFRAAGVVLNKVAEFNSASDNAMTTYQRGQIEALSFLIEHKDFNTLLTCLEYLRNPEIFKIDERAGFDNLYRMAHDLSSPRVEVIAGIQYRGARAFGNIMEDALKQNPANKDKEG